MDHLRTLSQAAEVRGDACNAGMRELAQIRKEVHDDHQMDRGSEERLKMKREVDDDDEDVRVGKGKVKKRKDRGGVVKEERPLAHGAHGVSRQDGASSKAEGMCFSLVCSAGCVIVAHSLQTEGLWLNGCFNGLTLLSLSSLLASC